MFRHHCLWFLISLIPLCIEGQSLNGIILGDSQPVPFATIKIKGTDLGCISDAEGYFSLIVPQVGFLDLEISAVGYKTLDTAINSTNLQSTIYTFFLKLKVDELEEVVITGSLMPISRSKSPVLVSVFSKKYLQTIPSLSLFESLQFINGVRPQVNCNVCNTGDIHINGLEGPYTLVLIDGLPLVGGLSSVYGLMGIPQSLIERLEIIKGPASSIYGSEAMGGVINVITKNPSIYRSFSLDYQWTSWLEHTIDMSFSNKISKNVSVISGIHFYNYNNIEDKNHDGFTDLALQNRASFFQKWLFKPSQHLTVHLAGRYFYEDRWGGQTQWSRKWRATDSIYGENIETKRGEIFGSIQFDKKTPSRIQWGMNTHQQRSAYGQTIFNADQLIVFGQWITQYNLPMGQVSGGFMIKSLYYNDNTAATSFQNNEINTDWQVTPGIYVQLEKSKNTHRFIVGQRIDYHPIHHVIGSPRVNYQWKKDQHSLRIGLGNGFRVAQIFTEDHAALTGARKVIFEETLKPERSWNAQTTYSYTKNFKRDFTLNSDFTVFYSYFTNRILPDYDTNPQEIRYGNLKGFAVSKGMTGNLDFQWKEPLSGSLGFTIQDVSTVENNVKERQLLTERWQTSWNIRYTFNKWEMSYNGILYGPMKLPLLGDFDSRPATSPVWSIQNIQGRYTFKQLKFSIGVKNLLNFTPLANSIARAFDPFDKTVKWDEYGNVMITPENPEGLTFDPSYVYAPNQGIRLYLGLLFELN